MMMAPSTRFMKTPTGAASRVAAKSGQLPCSSALGEATGNVWSVANCYPSFGGWMQFTAMPDAGNGPRGGGQNGLSIGD